MNGWFTPKGTASINLSYINGSADAFYVGDVRMEGIPVHEEFSQNIYSAYHASSCFKKLSLR
jgi:hypothetical protein